MIYRGRFPDLRVSTASKAFPSRIESDRRPMPSWWKQLAAYSDAIVWDLHPLPFSFHAPRQGADKRGNASEP